MGVGSWGHEWQVFSSRKIDLEVSEPINFSSGDHQHLVQKAAIKSGHSKGDQPFTYSSRNTPQEAIKYPRSKQRDAANTYAVQISDDVISEETITGPPGPFQDMSVRKGKSWVLELGKEQCFLKIAPWYILPERMDSFLFSSSALSYYEMCQRLL